MAQWAKALDTRPEDMSASPLSHIHTKCNAIFLKQGLGDNNASKVWAVVQGIVSSLECLRRVGDLIVLDCFPFRALHIFLKIFY